MPDIEKLKEKASGLPASPGVYIMKDAQGRVIYVGKAKNLPKRVTTYFQKTSDSYKTRRMVAQVNDFDFVVTNNEKEALILENSLIKKHRPKYNIILRDDKTYPYLRLTVQEDYPRLEVVRRIKKDGAMYFGPFSSATSMRHTLRILRQLFPLRQCRRPDVKAVDRPCLNHQLGRCLGPCGEHATKEEYRSLVDEVILFFKGKSKALSDLLKERMKDASARYDFENAARYRDRLTAVEKTLESQKVVSPDLMDRDVFGLVRERGRVMCEILFIRRGALLGNRSILLSSDSGPLEDILSTVLVQYYEEDRFIPEEVLVPVHLDQAELIQEWLRDKRGKTVRVLYPVRGAKKRLIELAEKNAVTALAERLRAADLGKDALVELQRKLGLSAPPRRIEGYDMSTLRGDSPVGAMVVLEDGRWVKNDYRRFRIKNASGQDDYAMMSEVIGRRLAREDPPAPDLMLLDGGRGQLGVALAVIEDLNIQAPPPLAGLAKGRDGEPDRVWLPGRKNPVELKADSPGLLLLMRVRDEAHRYVRTYHHRLRAQGATHSILDEIQGIGPSRRKALLKELGSLDAVKNADIETLAAVKGINRPTAEAVYDFFHQKND